MKKIIALLSSALLVFAVLQVQPAFAGAGCCPKGAKNAKMACGAEAASPMTCTVDGKTVACTKNVDGTCTLPAGTADAAAIKAGTKEIKVGDKTITAKVNADGSCVMACDPGSCHSKPAACGVDAKAEKKAKKAKKMKAESQKENN